MEREIMKDRMLWKDKKSRKPLLLTGVRQCGKTYILKKFAEENFDHFARSLGWDNYGKRESIAIGKTV